MNTHSINTVIRVSSFFGILLSIYALHVEISKENDKKYVALCDISEHMSCSNVFESSYGKGLGLVSKHSPFNQPNSVGGIFFYSVLVLLTYTNHTFITKLLVGLTVLSNIGSVYLAYILYFILYDFCIVCVSTYVVNAINLYFAIAKLKVLSSQKSKLKSK